MSTPSDSPPPAALSEPLMTADAVAALLAVPRSSVYEYARRQHAPLPAVRIGRHLRFLRSRHRALGRPAARVAAGARSPTDRVSDEGLGARSLLTSPR